MVWKRGITALSTALLMSLTVSCARADSGAVIINFEDIREGRVFCSQGISRGFMRGGAELTEDSHSGDKALRLVGARNKGVLDMGPHFTNSSEGTLDFWMKPASAGGIIAGKAGAVKIEIDAASKTVKFGLRLKDGWRRCEGKTVISPGVWYRVTASWGGKGMFLFLDGKEEDRKELPAKIEWNETDKHFLLGSYDYPAQYDDWFYDGIIDDFYFKPAQELIEESGAVKGAVVPSSDIFAVSVKVPERKIVSGVVYNDINRNGRMDGGEKGIAGVPVTDGYTVVVTDREGKYSLKVSDMAIFVYITKPSGFDVSDAWYKKIAGEVNFGLVESEKEKGPFGFIAVTDTHISDRRESQEGLKRFVAEVNELNPLPAFVVNCGDQLNLPKKAAGSESTGRSWYNIYSGIMNNLKMPYYNKAGDHSDVGYRVDEFPPGDPRWGKAMFWEYFGPTYYSFEYGKLHIAVNDDYYGYARREWFRQDLKYRSPETAIIFVEKLIDEIAEELPEFRQDMLLSFMSDPHIYFHRNNFVYAGALSGTWWNGICADLEPQGYVVVEVDGKKLDFFYKGLGEQVKINAPKFGSGVSGKVAINAHLVTGKNAGPLEYSINGCDWKPMQESGRTMYRVKYSAKRDCADFPAGMAEIRVRTADGSEEHICPVVIRDGYGSDYTAASDAVLNMKIGSVMGFPKSFPDAPVEVLVNGKKVGTIQGRTASYSFNVPREFLKKVNTVTFNFSKPGDGMIATNVQLIYNNETILDPYWKEVQKVRSNNWTKDIVDKSGVLIGDGGIHATSFAVVQNEFNFVLPANEAEKKSPESKMTAKSGIIIWKEAEELLPQDGWRLYRSLPAGSYDPTKYWSGEGAAYFNSKTSSTPLKWRFELKGEMDEAGVDKITREYHVWIHQYGYKDRKLTVKVDGQAVGTITSENTEVLDNKGGYVSAGHYIWQKAGTVRLGGGRHEIAIEPFAGNAVIINAILLTDDPGIIPEGYSLREKATAGFVKDVPAEWYPYISGMNDVYGLLPDMVTAGSFNIGHTGKGIIHRKDRKVTAVFDLPEGLKIKAAHQGPASTNSAAPGYEKIEIEEPVPVNKGKEVLTQYRINLSYIAESSTLQIYFYYKGNSASGEVVKGICRMEWDQGVSDEKEVTFRIAVLPDTKMDFKHLLFGTAGQSYGYVNNSIWPDFPELTKRAGMNAMVMLGNFYKQRDDLKERQELVRSFYGKGIQVFEGYSPWYSLGLLPPTVEEGAAVGIDGKIYKDYKNRTVPCPTFIEGNSYIEKELDILRTVAACGVSGIMFDDERFNSKGESICYCSRCVKGFREFLEHREGSPAFVEPVEIVKNKEKYPQLYDLWMEFCALGNTRRHALMKKVFADKVRESNADSTYRKGITIAEITVADGTTKTSREKHLWDLPSLAETVDYVCPMIYITAVSQVDSLISRVRNILDSMGGKKERLLVTLNCGYTGGGEISLVEKPLIKYSILECVLNGSQGAFFWNGFATYDPLSLEQIASALSMLAPYEDIIVEGKINHGVVNVSGGKANVSAIVHEKGILVLVSEYSKNEVAAEVTVPDSNSYELINAWTGKSEGKITEKARSFKVILKDIERAKLYFLKKL